MTPCFSGVILSSVLSCSLFLAVSEAYAADRFRQNGWDLSISRDGFTQQVRCDLATSNRRIRYQPGALGFRASKNRDTEIAWYKVDTAAPVRWQNRTAGLIASGVEIDGPAIDNPTGGWAWIPVDEVSRARVVSVRAGARDRIRRYRIGGFSAMLEAAHRLGCNSDDAFRI